MSESAGNFRDPPLLRLISGDSLDLGNRVLRVGDICAFEMGSSVSRDGGDGNNEEGGGGACAEWCHGCCSNVRYHCKRIIVSVIMIIFFIILIGLLAELRGYLASSRQELEAKIPGVGTEVPFKEATPTALWTD